MDTTTEHVKETVEKELPKLLRTNQEVRTIIRDIMRGDYAERQETQDWFHEMMAELRRDREEQTRKWEEQNRKLDEQNRKWEEQNRKWDEQNRKFDEHNRKWEEQNRKLVEEQNRKWDEQNSKWEEQNRKWDEQNSKWDANQKELHKLSEAIMALAKKHDRSIGALGSRWGLQSEKAFRDALAGILEESFDVQVLNVCEYDEQGEVFGRPDQIELDVIIKNGVLLIMELKSSIDKAGMYIFERKARFYERLSQRTADRLIVISPMIDARACKVAEELGIELYGDSMDVKEL